MRDSGRMDEDLNKLRAMDLTYTADGAEFFRTSNFGDDKDRVIVRENVRNVEDYLQLADMGLFTSESESFCLSILEAMYFSCQSIAPSVGGIPEVVEDNTTGLLVPFGDLAKTAHAVETLIHDEELRKKLGRAALARAQSQFSAAVIVPRYETLYRRVCGKPASPP